jgi:predicted PurR-regulated permease PerM
MENMFQKIGNSQNIIFLLGVIIYVVCLFTITDIALMFFVTYVVACALNPIVDKLEKKCSRNVAAAIVFGGFVGGLLLMFLPIIIIGGQELAHLAAQYPQYVDKVEDFIMNSPVVQEFANSGGLLASLTSISKGGLYLFVALIFTYFLIVDRDKILNAVWNYDYYGDLRTVDTHVKQLRGKLGEAASKYISTVRSVGYKLELKFENDKGDVD